MKFEHRKTWKSESWNFEISWVFWCSVQSHLTWVQSHPTWVQSPPHLGSISPHLGSISHHLGSISPHLGSISPQLGSISPPGFNLTSAGFNLTSPVIILTSVGFNLISPGFNLISPGSTSSHLGSISPHINQRVTKVKFFTPWYLLIVLEPWLYCVKTMVILCFSATSNIPLSSPERNGSGGFGMKSSSKPSIAPGSSKLETLKQWSFNTYKCTKQMLSERFGKGKATLKLCLQVRFLAPFCQRHLWSFLHFVMSCVNSTLGIHSNHFKTVRKMV